MSHDPYGAPLARVEDASEPGVSWWAALIGAAAGVGTPYLIGSVVSPPIQQWMLAQGATLDSLARAMTGSPGFNVLAVLLGAIGGVVGGHVAARLSGSSHILNAIAAAVIMIAATALLYFSAFPSPYPVWSQILGFLTPIPCAMLGARLYLRGRIDAADA